MHVVGSPVMVCSDLCCAVCSLHMLARQYSILLARQRKLNTRRYLIIASMVNTCITNNTVIAGREILYNSRLQLYIIVKYYRLFLKKKNHPFLYHKILL